MRINQTIIEDSYAEAFKMAFTRLLVTADDAYWLATAAREFTGYGTSVIGCDAEVGIEREADTSHTPDGRPGLTVLVFAFSPDKLQEAVVSRAGQTLMTCPTTAVFNGLHETETTIPLGDHLRYFGDGYQKSKLLGDTRLWRIPVMDGEFIVQDKVGVGWGVGGGNFILQSEDRAVGLEAARRASATLEPREGIITPFPGGVVRSGSKVGSKYKNLKASTAESFCPTLRGRVTSKLHPDASCAYEIVIDGIGPEQVEAALTDAIVSATGPGIVAIDAGNYGGKLGPFHFHLREMLDGQDIGTSRRREQSEL